ncbi:MAG: hypothetical protein U0791_23375 [Gemmataceae bacterium]
MSMLAETLTPSIVEVGKIKIGELGPPRPKANGSGTWRPPVKLDHFKITTLHRGEDGQLQVDEPLMASLESFADKKDKKLRALPIMFPSNDLDDIMQSTHVWYVGKSLGARREGKKVTFYFDPLTGQKLDSPRVGAWEDAFLTATDPCDRSKKRKLFKRFTTLNVMIAAGLARWGGLYKFRSCGEISARQLYSSLLVLQRSAHGVLRGPIFRMVVRPMQVSPEGAVTTVHVVHVEYQSMDANQLLEAAKSQAALEAASAVAIAESNRQLKQLLAAAVDDVPDEEEAYEPLEFGKPVVRQVVEGEVVDEPQPAPPVTKEEFAALLVAKGWNWPRAIDAINRNWKSNLPHASKWAEVPAEYLSDFAAWLRTEPEITKAEPQPAAAEKPEDVIAECEKLAVEVAGSWEPVRIEYGENFQFTRAKDLTPENAIKLRDALRLNLKVKHEAEANAKSGTTTAA